MKISLFVMMIIALVRASRLTAAFSRQQKITTTLLSQPHLTSLNANILQTFQESLSDTFSTMTTTSATNNKSKYFTVGITGSGGSVGSALRNELGSRDTVNGKPIRIVRLSRGSSAENKELPDATETSLIWNPNGSSADEVIGSNALDGIDAIVHLSGENVATGQGPLGFLGLRPWTNDKKAEILNSRVIPTQALAKAISESNQPKTFLCASGIGVYGDNFIDNTLDAVDETMDISSSSGFLADVSRQWEAATNVATMKKGNRNRVVNMRFGVVLSTKGGALSKLYPIFFLGGGGNVGSGKQYFSFISARDIARAIIHTLETPTLQGPVNFVTPYPCTNAEFTLALGKGINRPTIVPFPSFAVSILFGEMGEEMLLGGVRAIPGKLMKSGFQFQHPTIDDAIQSALNEVI